MWVIHKIRLHTHVGRLVVPVSPMAHHLGVGFVVKLDIEPFIVKAWATQVNSSQGKRGASGKPAAGVNNVKAQPVQCNRVAIEARNRPGTNLKRGPHRSIRHRKNVLVENQRLVSIMSKLNQSNATVKQSKREINPVPI